jgi:hypothetical protein
LKVEVIESSNAERPAVRCIAWLDGRRGCISSIEVPYRSDKPSYNPTMIPEKPKHPECALRHKVKDSKHQKPRDEKQVRYVAVTGTVSTRFRAKRGCKYNREESPPRLRASSRAFLNMLSDTGDHAI